MKQFYLVIGVLGAGLQAALFLTRAGIKTFIAGDPNESDLAYGRKIGNLFGVIGEPNGKALLENAIKTIKANGGQHVTDEVVDLKTINGQFEIKLSDGQAQKSKTVIIATGLAHLKAGIVNEDKFLGKGVHTCVACDGPFFKNKTVAVIGEGNFAAEEALELTAHTKKITIFTQKKDWALTPQIKKALEKSKVALRQERVVKVSGNTLVKSIQLEDGTEIKVDGVFIALGTTSSLSFAQKVGLEMENGFIKIDRSGKTSFDGIYAAGGCTGGYEQIAKSAGEGCSAAISIIKKIKGVASYVDQT